MAQRGIRPNSPHAEAAVDNEPALEVMNLEKRYGRVTALDGLTLDVPRGAIFGFLGPNGAGKTTAIRCLLDLIRPSSGSMAVLGLDPRRQGVEVRRRTGYLPGELNLEEGQKARDVFRQFASLRRGSVDWGLVDQLVARLDLPQGQAVRNLSKGNKQKVGLIQALMHRPELLLLDEPTSGLDPLVQQEVLSILRQARAEGATVFFSSHVLSEVQALAEHVGIIRAGRLVETASTESLLRRSTRRMRIRLRHPVEATWLSELAGVVLLDVANGTDLLVEVTGEMDNLVKAMAILPVLELETEAPTLEEVFLKYYSPEEEM